MKNYKLYILVGVVIISFVSCSEEIQDKKMIEEISNNGDYATEVTFYDPEPLNVVTRGAYIAGSKTPQYSLKYFSGSRVSAAEYTYIYNSSTLAFDISGTKWKWQSKAMDFYVVSPSFAAPAFSNVNITASSATFDYKVQQNFANQEDLVIASLFGVTKKNSGGSVSFKMTHTLSYQGFRAKNMIENTNVYIKSITIHNLQTGGTWSYTYGSPSKGSWTALNGEYGDYTYEFATPVSLSTAYTTITGTDYLFVIPQRVDPWMTTRDPNGAIPISTADANHQTYLEVKCQIIKTDTGEYVAGNVDNSDSSNPMYATVYFPFPYNQKASNLSINVRNTNNRIDFNGGFDANGEDFLENNAKVDVVVTSDEGIENDVVQDPWEDDGDNSGTIIF